MSYLYTLFILDDFLALLLQYSTSTYEQYFEEVI